MLRMVEDGWQLLTDALAGLSDRYIDLGLIHVGDVSVFCLLQNMPRTHWLIFEVCCTCEMYVGLTAIHPLRAMKTQCRA